jgi:O-antigen/teichoic acid export membrane protein
VWTIQVVRGWLLWLLSIAVAIVFYALSSASLLPENSVYNNATFPFIIAVIGLNCVATGYEPTKLAYGHRNLKLKINVIIALASQLLGFFAMLLWAYFQPDVWALVTGSVVASISMTVMSIYLIDGENNRFCWDKEIFHEIFHFGKWIFISSIMGFLVMSSDKLMLGGLVDAESLGYFAIAGLLVGAVGQLVGTMIHTVGFPALSETFRENPSGLRKVFYKLRLPFDLFLLFTSGFLFVTADTIVSILYDNRYQSVGWILQIMSISLFEIRYRLAGECFLAMGKPKLQSSLIFVNLVCLYAFGFGMYYMYGFKGVVWAVACSSLSTIPLILYYLKKFNILDWKRELIVLPVLLLGYAAGFTVNFIFDSLI